MRRPALPGCPGPWVDRRPASLRSGGAQLAAALPGVGLADASPQAAKLACGSCVAPPRSAPAGLCPLRGRPPHSLHVLPPVRSCLSSCRRPREAAAASPKRGSPAHPARFARSAAATPPDKRLTTTATATARPPHSRRAERVIKALRHSRGIPAASFRTPAGPGQGGGGEMSPPSSDNKDGGVRRKKFKQQSLAASPLGAAGGKG